MTVYYQLAQRRKLKCISMAKARSIQPRDDKSQRVQQIIKSLQTTYPVALCALNHETPFQLLVATILSAQCTDERVNMVTPALFKKYPTTKSLAEAVQEELEEVIRSTGFFRNKAKNLIGMSQAVMEHHGGELPKTLEELVMLPGVGRKTANVLLGTAYGIPSGVVVDTHVGRISKLLGLTKNAGAEQIERDLMALVPQDEWINFSHRLIHHGRQICVARRPKCTECPLMKNCLRVGLPKLPD
jgi:endonuclease-3